ncbi:MAG: OB-fold domain-containing protein [Deltaproteobacteria bacterium]|nr:OB-fold domain-containing protein [Deltaproteobacteria bacterium]
MERVPVHEGLFSSADGGHLLGARCGACGKWQFPAGTDCPYCSAEDCATLPLSPTGTLHLFTSVRNRPPGYVGEVPFGFGVVELPEGLRIISRLTESDPARLRLGMAVRLVLVPLHVDEQGREVHTYAFAPVEVAR